MAILKVLRSSRKVCNLLTSASRSLSINPGGNSNNVAKKSSTYVDTVFHEVIFLIKIIV